MSDSKTPFDLPPQLWLCPHCGLDTSLPHKSCPSCGLNLLLFACLKIEAAKLKAQKEPASAQALLREPPLSAEKKGAKKKKKP